MPWSAAFAGVVLTVAQTTAGPSQDTLSRQIDDHCRRTLQVAEELAADHDLRRLYAASGEALEPELPFEVLWRYAKGVTGRTVYLADDRGRLVAWAGEQRAFPGGLRPLGQRRWGLEWSVGGVVLYLREPMLLEGRLVGAVTVADFTQLRTRSAWGLRAPRGMDLVLGDGRGAQIVQALSAPAVTVPLVVSPREGKGEADPRWFAWLLLVVVALVFRPAMAAAVVAAAAAAFALGPGASFAPGLAALILAVAAAVARAAWELPVVRARVLITVTVVVAAAFTVFALPEDVGSWLPNHLLQPGWGAVWMVALAWLGVAWMHRGDRGASTLSRRLQAALVLAGLGVALGVARLPLDLARARVQPGDRDWRAHGISLPRDDLVLEELLPVRADTCRLDDLASEVARRWRLDRWRTPSMVRLVDASGVEVSRWGDLAPAGDNVRFLQSWPMPAPVGGRLEVLVATEPWSLLSDWRTSAARETTATTSGRWYAVLTRSGSIAASLHSEIRELEPATAGDLFYAGTGWAWVRVGDLTRLARVWRHQDWLVVVVARSPAVSVWVVRAAMAVLWALLGMVVARPPALRKVQLATFGGRLRLLVAGGVVIPLAVLTLLLDLRLRGEENRLHQAMGTDALRAARYTAVHLAGGFDVNDELARWLAAGWGGEVVLFDGARVIAVSRPDLMSTGALPGLPAPEIFPAFLLGRDEPVVLRRRGWLVAASAVELQGRRLLLELFRVDPLRRGTGPGVGDWLLTGAAVAALLALVLTSRVERRLSVSLRDLVAMAGRLLHGEPLGEIRRPREADLAEVLDAVRSMNQEVQQRELSLRNQEELLRITLATLTAAVVVLEPDGTLRFANPSAEALQAAHGDALLSEVKQLANRLEADGEPVVETVRPLPGHEVTWRIGVAGVPFSDGSRGLVAVVDDVSDVVRVDRLRQLNQLARIVAHEVKNPLTPVRLWVQELEEARRQREPGLDQLVGEACREISIQVQRLQTTASSFSNLVALERWEPGPVDVVELAEDALRGFSVLERRGVRVVRELPEAGRCLVTGDRQWLLRAIGNLVQNSVDALADQKGELHVRAACAAETVIIEVEDSAGGVPEARLQDLFSPHFSTTTAGSGLGLALVQQVVSRCQGRVFASNGERGLAVRLELPRRRPGQAPGASATMNP